MSDIHAGAETSLITNIVPSSSGGYRIDPHTPSPVTEDLSAALRATLAHLEAPDTRPADVVLLGDVLDLSLSPPERSAQVFETFATALFKGPLDDPGDLHLSDRIFFVPGNHDHSLWTALRYQTETFAAGLSDVRKSLADKGVLSRFAPVTPAFSAPNDKLQSTLIRDIVETATGARYLVPVYYPNLGATNEDETRAVVLHHGHFVEATYKLLSLLVAGFHGRATGPLTVEQLERENGNWIDFGWSTVGENGPIGEDVSTVYQFLLTGSEEGRLQTRFADTLARNLIKALPLPKTDQVRDAVKIISKGIIDATVGKFSQTERLSYTDYLGAESVQGLRDYIFGAVGQQMIDTFESNQPEHLSFVFGHTHKPFEDQIVIDGVLDKSPPPSEQVAMFPRPVDVYNTGGWILDTSLLSTKEGASIIFIDDDMHVASLRAFNITAGDAPILPKVYTLEPGNPMARRLNRALEDPAIWKLWVRFAQTVQSELRLRQRVILKSTAEADMRSAPRTGDVHA